MTAPTVDIVNPPTGATYRTGTTVYARYRCDDTESGVGLCYGNIGPDAPLDTSSPGTKTLSITAYDREGNTSTESRTYQVSGTAANIAATITPNTNLVDGLTVQVDISGMSSNAQFAMAQALGAGYNGGIPAAYDQSSVQFGTGTLGGTYTESYRVRRFITANGQTYDCATPGLCVIALGNLSQLTESTGVPISFGEGPAVDEASSTVGAGESVTTARDGGQTALDTLGTSVATPTAGTVTISESTTQAPSPPGYETLGQSVQIEAPTQDIENPLRITFALDSSLVPTGEDESTVQVFRNGVPIQDCLSTGPIDPDPCVSTRDRLGDGDVRITVLTSHASLWALGYITDDVAPTVTVTSPAQGSTFVLGQAVTPIVRCADGNGSGVAACGYGAVDTSSVGTKTFSVATRDHVGNRATVTTSYRVIYDFEGFFSPVDDLPVVNSLRAGGAVPVKFSLDGDQGLSVLSAGSPWSTQVACSSSAPVDAVGRPAPWTGPAG